MWRDWFTFSRQDQRGILLLAALIVVVLLLLWTKPMWQPEKPYEPYTPDSLLLSLTNQYEEETPIKVAPHPFDPNTADSLELLSVGFPPYVARNILRYRKAGGIFRKPNDLARIYGMHDTIFSRVEPYIAILMTEHPVESSYSTSPSDTARRKHPYADYMRAKYKPGKFVDLNTADTAELMKIPGIGPVYAKMIVDYREQLGGFHSIAQLHELGVLPEDIGDWTHVATPHTIKLRINHLSVTRLRSHPYLTFYQAKAIVDLRKREGDIKSIRQLLFLDEFTEKDIERLTPYLTFD